MPPLIARHGASIRQAAKNGDVEYLKWAKDLALRGSAVYAKAAENDWGRIRIRDHR
jgi:hypothetical protein